MAAADNVAQAYRHCEALVRAHDNDRYIASLFAPASRRAYLLALYAFDRETARVRSLVTEPVAGMIRLQWWVEAVRGERGEEAAASPVLIALGDASRAAGVDLAPLAGVAEARQSALSGGNADDPAAAIFMMAARLLGASGGAVDAAAQDAATATAMTDAAQTRAAYGAFRAKLDRLPKQAGPAFLPVALVPLLLKYPQAPAWRRQLALARAAYFGFPAL